MFTGVLCYITRCWLSFTNLQTRNFDYRIYSLINWFTLRKFLLRIHATCRPRAVLTYIHRLVSSNHRPSPIFLTSTFEDVSPLIPSFSWGEECSTINEATWEKHSLLCRMQRVVYSHVKVIARNIGYFNLYLFILCCNWLPQINTVVLLVYDCKIVQNG